MTVTFFSNFLLHHQTPFCEAMVKRLGDGFKFVATEPVPKERLDMGYGDLSRTAYCVNAYENEEEYKKAMKLGDESDVVIIGAAPYTFIEKRLKENRFTLCYSERFFKQGRVRILDPRVFFSVYGRHTKYRKSNLYMLCASAYTAPDCRFIGAYPNKTYKWGYFPEVKRYDDIDEVISRKKPNSILWCGRFLGWKHPEAAIYVAKKLKDDGIDFSLDMIGIGELEEKIKKETEKLGLADKVRLLGSMSPEKVREHMESTEIFLFTSDKGEGWGAVLNESMNSGCAVVANRAIGSVPYLLKDGENGMIYGGKFDELYEKVKTLLESPKERRSIGAAAYRTLTDVWNAEAATERLLSLIENLKNGKDTPFMDGPCSKD
ncbi:MAG: glycosyltransferase [Clostridia bacterium]|nr:glycosyltransferase [Clostridia bacterium]